MPRSIAAFPFRRRRSGRRGPGPGQVGDAVCSGRSRQERRGQGRSSRASMREVELSLEELAESWARSWSLPRIEPKASTAHHPEGSLRGHPPHRPPSRCAISSAPFARPAPPIMMGHYDPKRPMVVPVHEIGATARGDCAHAPVQRLISSSWTCRADGRRAAGNRAHRILWIDTWLRTQYDGLESR